MTTSLRMVKGVESVDKLTAKRVALHMVANNVGIQHYNDRRVDKALGIQPRNLKKHRADIQAKTFKWVGEGCKRRANCLSGEVLHSIIQFWTSNTRVSPNKKDVCRQRISQTNYRFHPSHYLELTEAKIFMNFKEKHPSIDFGFHAFQSLKPFFVRKLKERNTCCCVYHTRIDLMHLAIRSLRIDTKSIHGDACDCLCMICRPNEEDKCSAYAATFSSVSKLWRSTVCPKEESAEWQKLACLLRTCKQCPKPLFCPQELDVANQELVKWKTFDDLDGFCSSSHLMLLDSSLGSGLDRCSLPDSSVPGAQLNKCKPLDSSLRSGLDRCSLLDNSVASA
ncbi:hypothetical protein L7F22_003509 [Adiantum nelumboides]|nr:hypothetical protein [Adiantum nelumboides]